MITESWLERRGRQNNETVKPTIHSDNSGETATKTRVYRV